MEINSYKQPELTALLEKHFKGEASRYDVRPNADFLTVAESMNLANAKNINYKDLQPEKVYALRTTTTDLNTGKQEMSYSLFLDRKMAAAYYFQHTPKDNLVLNHQVQHGIIIEGNVNNKLLAKLQMAPSGFNEMLVVSSLQNQYDYSGTQKRQVEQASEIAEKIFKDLSLTNEYATNILPKGAQEDLYKYYELTHAENPKIIHTDAWSIQEKKEAVIANEPYAYVGLIHSKDHSTPSVAYTSEKEYLQAIEEGLKTNPRNLGYETLSTSPQLHKQVEDLVFKSYGLTNPYPIEYYTPQGREPSTLEKNNHPEITIMDLAKELGFNYNGRTVDGFAVMKQDIQADESRDAAAMVRVSLEIKDPDNPKTNYVNVDYSYLDGNRQLIVRDNDFHLTFNDFVNLTKSLNSEEILRKMEQKEEYVGTITYKSTNEKISYLDKESFLEDLKDALLYQPNNIKYKILTQDKDVKEKVKDMMYNFFGMETPQQAIGQSQIKIMDLAKELGFSYEGKDSLLGDAVMRYRYEYDNKESGQKESAHVALSIKNPDDPQTNTVNVITTFFDANQHTIGTYYDNNQTFDQFVNLMKSIGSVEALKTIEQRMGEASPQLSMLSHDFIQQTIKELDQKGGYNNTNDFEVDLYHLLRLSDTNYLTQAQYESQVKDIIKLAQQQPENEIAAKVIENAKAPVFNLEQQPNIETKPIESFNFETASMRNRDYLVNDLQDKFKLEPETISKFTTYMEAARPMEGPINDKDTSKDIVVFPYVRMDDSYNLEGHQYTTLSAVLPTKTEMAQNQGKNYSDETNLIIGYEMYTKGQTIPVKPYTTNAALDGGVWMATEAQKPNQVKDVIMFNSAVDAMSFYELNKNGIDLKNTALISVGNIAKEKQVYGIVERFPEAKIHTAFQNTLLGELSNITVISLASIGQVRFKMDENGKNMDFTTYYDKFSLPVKDINLQNFKEKAHIKESGITYDLKDIQIHRPFGKTYNMDLQAMKQQQSEKQEQHHKFRL